MKFLRNNMTILFSIVISVTPIMASDSNLLGIDGQEVKGLTRKTITQYYDKPETFEDWLDSKMMIVNDTVASISMIYAVTGLGPLAFLDKLLEKRARVGSLSPQGAAAGMRRARSFTSMAEIAQEGSSFAFQHVSKILMHVVRAKTFVPVMGGIALAAGAYYVYQHWDWQQGFGSNIYNVRQAAWEDASWLASKAAFALRKVAGYSLAIGLNGAIMPYICTKAHVFAFARMLKLNHAMLGLRPNAPHAFGKYLVTLAETGAVIAPYGSANYQEAEALKALKRDMFRSIAQLDLGKMQEVFFQQVPEYMGKITNHIKNAYTNGWNWVKSWF